MGSKPNDMLAYSKVDLLRGTYDSVLLLVMGESLSTGVGTLVGGRDREALLQSHIVFVVIVLLGIGGRRVSERPTAVMGVMVLTLCVVGVWMGWTWMR